MSSEASAPPSTGNRPSRVLVVAGSARTYSNVAAIVSVATQTLLDAGATVRCTDLAALRPPVFVHKDATQEQLPAVRAIRADATWADALLLVTPEYHGNMSGALKNWFDFLYLELAGKLAGAVAVTGGGGGDMSLTAVHRSVAWCHGFCLPYRAAARNGDFSEQQLANPQVIERIQRIAYDLVRYVGPLRDAWANAQRLGNGVTSGVAGLHREDRVGGEEGR